MEQKRKAAALKYKENFDAPVISAHGMGQIADKIIETAKENDVPIVYNKELTDLLCNVSVGDTIPYEVYDAVASIIAYITEIDKKSS
ncbi:EscU/YscU/HrcU family type III secretion system export apparatus switch protein [uncultured Clostridium sp.]|uniref:EscU/YscU/HrcU family type III secretion system export apparatus switch protein n=1 Tax=uncultured Clostridium sp. TaxID=59620 RepID=UPI00261B5B7F|nr:EscU/YscU/HrcU family type III secretion system export apparatus switch protein [uncultured Clostridium sp.]